MFVWNRLPNHAHYSDEPFAGDSVGQVLGQRLNVIFKKTYSKVPFGQSPPDKKIQFTSPAGPLLIFVMSGDYEPI